MINLKKNKLPILTAQPGPQTKFESCAADVAIYGGAAGGGKTYGLLRNPLRYVNNPRFGAVIFRRNSTQVRNKGGLWDTSMELYAGVGAVPRETNLLWTFKSGATVKFNHMQYESDILDWQGSQIPMIGFDELTHFTENQFWYMFSRNRSTCGVKPYIRATTNPDAESWVRKLIDWWIDPLTGIAIPERSGKVRWFVRVNDEIHWANRSHILEEKFEGCIPKSFTYISATIYDNQILLKADKGYLANLNALSQVERERLLNGNWNIKASAGLYFQRGYFEIVDAIPSNRNAVRYWDRAATKKTADNDPDFTVGILIEKDLNNIIYIKDVVRIQDSPLGVQTVIKNTAIRDGISVRIGIEEDPGQAGVADAEHLTRLLQGFNVKRNRVMKDKVTRASPVSAQAEAGNIKVKRASWNDEFFKELENFPEGKHDDIVDALSGAFLMINEDSYNILNLAR